MKQFEQYIDGEFDPGSAQFDSINPATEQAWARLPEARGADVERAVSAAYAALSAPAWRGLSATARGKLLYRLGDLVAENVAILAQLETEDTGKIIRETSAQIGYVAEFFRYFGGLADKVEGAHLPIDKPDMEAWIRREPIGVVAAIVPWNSQLFLAAVKLGPALAAGCTVVLKCSEEGCAPLLEFARLVHEAGFPRGVVNIITGFGDECGIPLTRHPLVSRIAFTGGPETARHVVRNSAENLAYTTLELGGKSPIVVFDDVDVESVANVIVAAIFAAMGQSCVAGSRLIVHRDIKQELLACLVRKAEAIKIGDPQEMATEVGPLATVIQRDWIEKIIAESIAAGATLLTGGGRPEGFDSGYYFQPTILDCPDSTIASVANELFGPVLSVLSFDTEAEALELANATQYGLGSGVFTQNIGRAHRMVDKIHAGIVWINTYRAISPIAPFGGYGLSGLGRESGRESILDYTRQKTVWLRTSDEPVPDPFVMR